VRDAFAGEQAAIERRIHDELRRALMTVAIVGDAVAVRCPSETIAQSARELHCATSGADTDLVRVTARQRPVAVAGDLRLARPAAA